MLNRLTRPIVLLSLVVCLSHCSALEPRVEEYSRLSDTTARQVEKTLGALPEVGFKMQNGKLESVSVTFEHGQLKDVSISGVEHAVRQSVQTTFKGAPREIALVVMFR